MKLQIFLESQLKIKTVKKTKTSHTRGSGNLIWSTLTWSIRGMHIRLGSTMSEAMMSMMVSSDKELKEAKIKKTTMVLGKSPGRGQ